MYSSGSQTHKQMCISFNSTGFSGIPSVTEKRSTPEMMKGGSGLTRAAGSMLIC